MFKKRTFFITTSIIGLVLFSMTNIAFATFDPYDPRQYLDLQCNVFSERHVYTEYCSAMPYTCTAPPYGGEEMYIFTTNTRTCQWYLCIPILDFCWIPDESEAYIDDEWIDIKDVIVSCGCSLGNEPIPLEITEEN